MVNMVLINTVNRNRFFILFLIFEIVNLNYIFKLTFSRFARTNETISHTVFRLIDNIKYQRLYQCLIRYYGNEDALNIKIFSEIINTTCMVSMKVKYKQGIYLPSYLP